MSATRSGYAPIGRFFLLATVGILMTSTYQNTYGLSPTLSESKENIDAATVLYQKNITKVTPQDTAFYETMSRKTTALLIKRFATNILDAQEKQPTCTFNDIGNIAPADQQDIIDSCKLWLFKWSANMFSPDTQLTRGQLVMVVARLISRDSSLEKDAAYDYLLHLGIVTVDDRNMHETPALRKDLYIMLHRIITTISQISAFWQFTNNFAVGNTTSTSITPTINAATQVLKVIAYKKDSMFGNYVAQQLWSAVMITNNKLITNAHVVLGDDDELLEHYEVCKTQDNNTKPLCFRTATVDYYDSDRDLALLSIQPWAGALPKPVTLATSIAKNGDSIDVRGYPGIGGNTITFTKWVISGIEKDKYKSDVKIDHGNSGGGAFNKKWELVGIPNSAQEDTDTLAYIIPASTVKEFLEKEWDIIENENMAIDTAFITYMSDVQKQKNSTSIQTPFFTLPSIGDFSLDTYSLDSKRGLYNATLSSQDNNINILLSTTTTNKDEPKINEEKNTKDMNKYCTDAATGTTVFNNTTWDYIKCNKMFGDSSSLYGYNTATNSWVSITATLISNTNNQKNITTAENLIKTITTTTATRPSYNMYDIWWILTLPTRDNLFISYSIDDAWDISIDSDLVYPTEKENTNIYINAWEVPKNSFTIMNKRSFNNLYSESNSYIDEYYDSTLSGSLIKTSKNNIFYIIGRKDKAEDLSAGEQPTRRIELDTTILYNNKVYSISINFSYNWLQNTQRDQDILSFIDQLTINGTLAFTDIWWTPIPLSQITIKP